MKKSHPHLKSTITVFLVAFLFLSANTVFAGKSITIPSKKYKNISQAIIKAKSGDTIWVKEGTYKQPIKLKSGITLISLALHKSTIDGAGSENVVVMGNNSTISGFIIKNGRVGVYSEGTNNKIEKCLIHDNQLSGITCVGHLPNIIDNVIVHNGGSGIQGWDVRSTISTINHNTVAYNSNSGLSIGGKSDIVIENNIIAYNVKLGMKVEQGVKAKLVKNNFYLNTEIIHTLPANNFSFIPMFISASSMNFKLSNDSKCRNMSSDGKNLGARLIY